MRFFGYLLYIMDLINVRKIERTKSKMVLQEAGLWEHGLDCSGSGQGQVASCCECSNEHSGSIK